ncbi:MAG: hypothetical protein KJ548_11570 [Actinobacteria bacterium]|nr:hypothetical protein [Actinomycetota bacterium]MCG2797460.1 hypothetical protein [Cellulomonas sp.]
MTERARHRIRVIGIAAAIAVGGLAGVASYVEPLWGVLAVAAAIALIFLLRRSGRDG